MERQELLQQYKKNEENLINILHVLQNNNPQNFLTTEDLKLVAEYLNITQSAVYGVATYYTMFSLKPRGKYLIRVCKSPLCQMIGANSIVDEIKHNIGIGELSDDLMFSVEASECLGHCAEAPLIMINDGVYKNLDSDKVKKIFQNIKLNHKNTD
jgi:NADH-quinone oxidoreductase subunit E